MMLKNTATVYGTIVKFFHWLMATLIIAMFSIACTMINILVSRFSDALFNLYKATGLLIFGLLILRLVLRFINKTPKLPFSIPLWQRQLAKFNITALYLLMLAIPINRIFYVNTQ